MRIPRSRLCLLAGAAAVALFTASMLFLSGAPSDTTVHLPIGLTALVLAFLLVHAVLTHLGRQRTDARLDALARAARDRFEILDRDAQSDRIFTRGVLQDISEKMDGLAYLELTQVRILRDMTDTDTDTGGFPIRTP